MELWDLYTKEREKTGKTMMRGEAVPDGYYRFVVHICIFNDNGEMLIQKRQPFKSGWSGLWDVSVGGSAIAGDTSSQAAARELREELGAEVEVVCKIGVVEDYYNLIHRHNINNYFLCRVISFGEKNMTDDEINTWHLTTMRLTFDEAMAEYKKSKGSRLGRLISNREMPILIRAKEIMT